MPSNCLIVANLPNRADVAFLNTLFEGNVVDSIWAGYGVGRFAVVRLTSAEYAAKVLAAREAYTSWKSMVPGRRAAPRSRSTTKKNSNGDQANQDDARDVSEMTVGELCAIGERVTPEQPQPKTPNAVAVPSAFDRDPFFGEVRSDQRILFIDASPITIDEILATGCVPGRNAHGAARPTPAAKRLRVTQSAVVEDATEAETASPVKQPRHEAPAATPEATNSLVPQPETSGVKRERVKKAKAPQRTTFDMEDEAVTVASSAPVPAPVVVARPAPAVVVEAPKVPPSFVRTSKDQCAFCGSEAHLSRHCPNKK